LIEVNYAPTMLEATGKRHADAVRTRDAAQARIATLERQLESQRIVVEALSGELTALQFAMAQRATSGAPRSERGVLRRARRHLVGRLRRRT
jgi:hypothetical protein